ncbi:MAG TPA: hypothetical protein VLC46_25295 [Thermoanaerobaculia bacterium]|jgi:hypothetical protein|nr:hypothetical protein [Thermoanaerobaculia bacterium]
MKKTVPSAENLIAIEAQVNSDRATPSTDSSEGPMAGSMLHEGDIVSPVEVEWDADQAPSAELPRSDGRVLYNGRWMIPVAAERERSIEHLRGSGRVLGDIVSPIDDVEWDALK